MKYYRLYFCLFVYLIFAVCLTSCATVPDQEAKAFSSGVKSIQSASDLLLDDVNVAEKSTGLRIAKRVDSFRIEYAYFYANVPTDLPRTGQFRRAINIISEYAALLQSLIEGAGSEQVSAQIASIASDVSALSGQPEFSLAAQAFTPFINQAVLWEGRAEAHDLALKGAPAVHALIDDLRRATPAMFDILRADLISKEGPSSPKLEAYKTELGNFIVLLDKLETTFDALLAAYSHPSSLAQLQSLSEATGELNAGVKIMRQTLAENR
jgi:hypothetical protein